MNELLRYEEVTLHDEQYDIIERDKSSMVFFVYIIYLV